MSEVSFWECPNCGSTDLVEIAPNKRRCVYCGSVLTPHGTTPDMVKCPRCGFDNERGDRYCNNCGRALVSWAPVEIGRKTDPAIISMIATVVGSFFIPIGGAILGLVLGYKALREARAGGERGGSEKLARTAIIVGWVVIAMSIVPLCMALSTPGVEAGCSACDSFFQTLSDVLR